MWTNLDLGMLKRSIMVAYSNLINENPIFELLYSLEHSSFFTKLVFLEHTAFL